MTTLAWRRAVPVFLAFAFGAVADAAHRKAAELRSGLAAPLGFFTYGGMIAIQSLWAGYGWFLFAKDNRQQ